MKKLHVIPLLVLALSAAPPPEARAQDTPQQRIEAARRRAASTGIPVTLLDSKVAEGRAKGVPMERIAGAVERRLASLGRAREAMAGVPRGAPVTSADLAVGADAIEAGVEPRALGRLAAASPGDRRAVAIAVLTELVNSGLSSERALERVTAALARGPEALRRLPGEAAAERSRGNGPPAGRGRPAEVGGRGRGQGGPPASVPGPTRRPDREERGKGKGKP
ncbi:MAG TPA: hypothetical protein VFQ45_00275 [Longimicrobium sp.]|nr:hypothetical protein [Longimicrobium sp.]